MIVTWDSLKEDSGLDPNYEGQEHKIFEVSTGLSSVIPKDGRDHLFVYTDRVLMLDIDGTDKLSAVVEIMKTVQQLRWFIVTTQKGLHLGIEFHCPPEFYVNHVNFGAEAFLRALHPLVDPKYLTASRARGKWSLRATARPNERRTLTYVGDRSKGDYSPYSQVFDIMWTYREAVAPVVNSSVAQEFEEF